MSGRRADRDRQAADGPRERPDREAHSCVSFAMAGGSCRWRREAFPRGWHPGEGILWETGNGRPLPGFGHTVRIQQPNHGRHAADAASQSTAASHSLALRGSPKAKYRGQFRQITRCVRRHNFQKVREKAQEAQEAQERGMQLERGTASSGMMIFVLGGSFFPFSPLFPFISPSRWFSSSQPRPILLQTLLECITTMRGVDCPKRGRVRLCMLP